MGPGSSAVELSTAEERKEEQEEEEEEEEPDVNGYDFPFPSEQQGHSLGNVLEELFFDRYISKQLHESSVLIKMLANSSCLQVPR